MNLRNEDQYDDAPARTSGFSFSRALPLALLAIGLALFFIFDLDSYLTFDTLKTNRDLLTAYVAQQHLFAALSFIGVYIVVVAFSLPGGAVMYIAGGFLFGWAAATIYIIVGATIGATVLFVAAKTALADSLRNRAGGMIQKMEDGFRDNAFNYLLVLRLVPLFPFWLVNLVPALLGVNLRTYIVATFIGILPGTAVYASVGNGLGAFFDRGETPDLGIIFEPSIFLPLIGLAILALIPIMYNKFTISKTSTNK